MQTSNYVPSRQNKRDARGCYGTIDHAEGMTNRPLNKAILENCNKRRTKLSTAWIDKKIKIKKGFDSVPRSCMMKCKQVYINNIQIIKITWKAKGALEYHIDIRALRRKDRNTTSEDTSSDLPG